MNGSHVVYEAATGKMLCGNCMSSCWRYEDCTLADYILLAQGFLQDHQNCLPLHFGGAA